MKVITLTTIIFICSLNFVQSQTEPEYKNQFINSIYRIETISEGINSNSIINIKANRLFNELLYERHLRKNVFGVFGIGYGEKTIEDDCKTCRDHFYGIGNFKEFNLLVGSKISIGLFKSNIIIPLIEPKIYYSRSSYSGNFQGGFSGQGLVFDNKYNKFGFLGSIGADIVLYNRIIITPLCSIKIGYIFENRNLDNSEFNYLDLSIVPIEFRMGINF